MAKNVFLYGVLLGFIVRFCVGVGGADLSDVKGSTDFSSSKSMAEGVKFPHERIEKGLERIEQGFVERKQISEEARDKLQRIYTAELGVREATGKNDGERVEEYLAVTNLGKGYAWCAAFVSWVYVKAGFDKPITPWTPSLFPESRVIWSQVNRKTTIISQVAGKSTSIKNTNPARGDVFGIYFSNLRRIAHAGFVDEWGDKYLISVEGNTNEAGSAEGDGVYRKRRLISSIYQVANWVDEPKGIP